MYAHVKIVETGCKFEMKQSLVCVLMFWVSCLILVPEGTYLYVLIF